MRNEWACVDASGNFRIVGTVGALIVLAVFLTIGFVPPAQALPSFARQTGQPCGTCHTDFPALTPYGRRFKLLGYTVGGGMFRTTPFPAFADNARAEAAKMGLYLKAPGAAASDDKDYVPPLSTMAIIGYTHTQAPLPPPTDPFKPNDNVVLSPFSGFWGGAITDNIGAFAQVTYGARLRADSPIRSATPGAGTTPIFVSSRRSRSGASTRSWASPPTTTRPSRTCGTPRRPGPFPTPRRPSRDRRPPALSSRAHSRPMSAAPASTPTSKTSCIWRRHYIGRSISGRRILGRRRIPTTRAWADRRGRSLLARGRSSCIGAIITSWVGTFGLQTNIRNWTTIPAPAMPARSSQTDKFTGRGLRHPVSVSGRQLLGDSCAAATFTSFKSSI